MRNILVISRSKTEIPAQKSFLRMCISFALILMVSVSAIVPIHDALAASQVDTLSFTRSYYFEYEPNPLRIAVSYPIINLDWRLSVNVRVDIGVDIPFEVAREHSDYVRPSSEAGGRISASPKTDRASLTYALSGYISFEDISGKGKHSGHIDLSALDIRGKLPFTAPLGRSRYEVPIPIDLLDLLGLPLGILGSFELHVVPVLEIEGTVNGEVRVRGGTLRTQGMVSWTKPGEIESIRAEVPKDARDGEAVSIDLTNLNYLLTGALSGRAFFRLTIPLLDYLKDYPLMDIPRKTIAWSAPCGEVVTCAFKVDALPPDVSAVRADPPSPNYEQSVEVKCVARDARSGVSDMTLHYSVDGGASWKDIRMNRIGADTFTGSIPPEFYGTTVTYFVEALDKVGNTFRTQDYTYFVEMNWLIVGIGATGVVGVAATVLYLRRRKSRLREERARPISRSVAAIVAVGLVVAVAGYFASTMLLGPPAPPVTVATTMPPTTVATTAPTTALTITPHTTLVTTTPSTTVATTTSVHTSSISLLRPEVEEVYWTVSDARVVSAEAGKQVAAHVVLKATTGSVKGTLAIEIRKDLPVLPDEKYEEAKFQVDLKKGQRKDFEILWTPRDASGDALRGYFIRVTFENENIYEMEASYPPRLRATKGELSIAEAYWIVNGQRVDSCEIGESVEAHVRIASHGGSSKGKITLKVKKDIPLQPDQDFAQSSFDVDLGAGQSKDLKLAWIPKEPTSSSLRGYFIEVLLNDQKLWSMPDSYPPRLKVTAPVAGTLKLVEGYWTVDGKRATTAEIGKKVRAHVTVQAEMGPVSGKLTVKVNKDITLAPDVEYAKDTFSVQLEKDAARTYAFDWEPDEASEGSLDGYYIETLFSGAKLWDMPDAYPPRLKVTRGIQGVPRVTDAYWIVDGAKVTQCNVKDRVEAHVKIKASKGRIDGKIRLIVKKDIDLWPDSTYKYKDESISVKEGETIDIHLTFSPDEASEFPLNGYHIQVEFTSWGGDWTMEDSYPPRLKVY